MAHRSGIRSTEHFLTPPPRGGAAWSWMVSRLMIALCVISRRSWNGRSPKKARAGALLLRQDRRPDTRGEIGGLRSAGSRPWELDQVRELLWPTTGGSEPRRPYNTAAELPDPFTPAPDARPAFERTARFPARGATRGRLALGQPRGLGGFHPRRDRDGLPRRRPVESPAQLQPTLAEDLVDLVPVGPGLSSVVTPLVLVCCRAEGPLRMQGRRLRGLGRVPRRAQLPLLQLPRDHGLGVPALGRDRAREAEGDEGDGLAAGRRRRRRRPRERAASRAGRSSTGPRAVARGSAFPTGRSGRAGAQADRAHLRRLEGFVVRDPVTTSRNTPNPYPWS